MFSVMAVPSGLPSLVLVVIFGIALFCGANIRHYDIQTKFLSENLQCIALFLVVFI